MRPENKSRVAIRRSRQLQAAPLRRAGAALLLSHSVAPGLRSLTNYFQACTLDICKLLIRATREKSPREMEAKLHH